MAGNKPKVIIGLPTMGSVHTHLMLLIIVWIAEALQGGKYNLSVYPTVAVQPVDNARNEIVRTFLEETDGTHLLFIDSDTIPPRNVIQSLLDMDVPIATAITPIIEHDEATGEFYRKWNVVDQNDKHVQPNTGIIEAKGAGSSCIMIRRDVFEKMEKPYYRFLYQDDNGKPTIVSEDIYFTIRALSLGFKTYADTSLICKHAKTTMW